MIKVEDNYIQFANDWEKLAEKSKSSVGQVMRKVSIDLWTEITRRNPVDTGRSRANWQMTVGAPSNEVDTMPSVKSRRRVDAQGNVTYVGTPIPTPPVPNVVITGEQDVFLTNNLPYIGALESGHSDQAPSGFIALSVEAVQAHVDAFVNLPEP